MAKNLTPEQAQYLALLKNRGLVKARFRSTTCSQPPLSILNAANIGIELFGEQGLKSVVEDITSRVLSA